MGVKRSCDYSGTEAFLVLVGVGVCTDKGRAKGSTFNREEKSG